MRKSNTCLHVVCAPPDTSLSTLSTCVHTHKHTHTHTQSGGLCAPWCLTLYVEHLKIGGDSHTHTHTHTHTYTHTPACPGQGLRQGARRRGHGAHRGCCQMCLDMVAERVQQCNNVTAQLTLAPNPVMSCGMVVAACALSVVVCWTAPVVHGTCVCVYVCVCVRTYQ